MTENKYEGMFFTRPINSRNFHIFQGKKSLCGKWLMLNPDSNSCVNVTGNETRGNEDCKACFKMAGLKLD